MDVQSAISYLRQQFLLSEHRLWSWFLVAGMLASARLFDEVWFIAIPTLAFAAFLSVAETPQKPKLLFHLWVMLLTYHLLALSWFWGAYPLKWAVGEWWLAALMVAVAWFLAALFLSLGVVGLVPMLFVGRQEFRLVLFPVFWVLQEYLAQWFFSLLTYGAGNLTGAHFSVNMVGYTLANHNWLLQIAQFGDVYGLSFLVAAMAVILCFGVQSRFALITKGKVMVVAIVLILGSSFIPVPLNNHAGTSLKLGLVQTNFSKYGELNTEGEYEKIKQIIAEESVKSVDVLVFPEEANFVDRAIANDLEWLKNNLSSTTLLVDSGPVSGSEAGYLRSAAYTYQMNDLQRNIVYEKRFQVPMGEYIPEVVRITFKLFGLGGEFGRVDHNLQENEVGQIEQTVTKLGWQLDVKFCAEVTSPKLYKPANESKNILLNLASHSFFGDTTLLHSYISDIAKVRAVANQSYYGQATNGSPALLIAPNGLVLAESAGQSGLLIITLP